jgi:hypothetical protein
MKWAGKDIMMGVERSVENMAGGVFGAGPKNPKNVHCNCEFFFFFFF